MITLHHALQPGDIGGVIKLHGSQYFEEFNYDPDFESYVAKGMVEFHERFDEKLDAVWTYKDDETIAGFVLLMHRRHSEAQLRFFIIHSAYRNKGLGTELLRQLIEKARELQYKRIYLWTTHEQQQAIALYIRLGFALTEVKESYLFGKKLNEQRYDLIL
jgi:ribosomal protein S18 acetylase RimI-like enzyme